MKYSSSVEMCLATDGCVFAERINELSFKEQMK